MSLPRLRFPEFLDAGEWGGAFGGEVFNQVSNKDHNSDLPVLAITQEHGAVPRSLIDYHVSVADKSIEGYKVVDVGDFIISLRSFQGGIEYSRCQGICSPALYLVSVMVSCHHLRRSELESILKDQPCPVDQALRLTSHASPDTAR